jgi:hypothetical protein
VFLARLTHRAPDRATNTKPSEWSNGAPAKGISRMLKNPLSPLQLYDIMLYG